MDMTAKTQQKDEGEVGHGKLFINYGKPLRCATRPH